MDDIAIRVDDVSKDFRLPHEKVGSLKSLVVNLFGRQKSFETQHALRNVSFEIKKGEFFGVVGRNGSGKSTLLKILAGIYQPTRGKVTVRGKLVPFIELGVGFNPELTGRENVYLNGALLGFSKKEIDIQYNDIVAFAELERFMDQKLKNYSSGMQVRLAFSVATRANADILLVDEVLAVGDADFQKKCFSYFRQLKKKKKTVVFVSHDMNAIREYCDKTVLIEKGRVACMGKPDDVAKKYTRLFIPEQLTEGRDKREVAEDGKWGLGAVNMSAINLKRSLLTQEDKELVVIINVVAEENQTQGLVPGIVIKNEAGQGICGTNSMILKQPKLKLYKGQKVTLEWRVPNIFNEGKYVIEPAIVRAMDMEVCQWWDSAATFEVINEEKTPYFVAPKIILKVDEA